MTQPQSSVVAQQFGETLRLKRQLIRWRQYELAEQAGMYRSHISEIENGRREITLETAVKLARVLDLSLDGLLE